MEEMLCRIRSGSHLCAIVVHSPFLSYAAIERASGLSEQISDAEVLVKGDKKNLGADVN